MKVILKVAKTELRTLFYSPIAWFIMAVFLVQCGVCFFGQMEGVARYIEMSGSATGEYYNSITEAVFLGMMGLFNQVMANLYLYVPLLTMSLISREMSSGTIKLLYSSPVNMYEIVLGKYIAMMCYSLLLVLIIGIFMLYGIVNIQHAETGMLLSALFGFYLVLCAYSAIGLFMSCLTGYQVVAAISSFVMIGILSYIGRIWQDIDFVRELTYYLSISGRTQRMLAGLITTKDTLYFFIIVYIFLGLSIYKLRAGMESASAMVKSIRYATVVVSALFIGYISSIPAFVGYWDTTLDKSRTLTPRVQQIVKDLGEEPLEVTAFVNLLDRYYYLGSATSYNSNLAKWEAYRRFKDNIIFKKITYYDSVPSGFGRRNYAGKSLREVAEQYAKSMDVDIKSILTPQQLKKHIDLTGEGARYMMELKWKGRTTRLRVFDDMLVWPSETEVAAALMRLQQATLPKIAFINSELEREIDKSGDRDYKSLTNLPTLRQSLINQGFDVLSVSLENDSIPADLSVLVMADPRMPLTAISMQKLQQYIDKGGNLLLAGEPGKQAVLNPILKSLGVQLNEGTLVQASVNDAPDFVQSYVEKNAAPFYRLLEYAIEDSIRVSMPGAAGISYQSNGPFAIQPLLKTDPAATWNRTTPMDMQTAIHASVVKQADTNGAAAPVSSRRDSLGTIYFDQAHGDVMGPLTTAVKMERKMNGKQQRIVVVGDADFLSNKELSRYMRTANFVFGVSMFRWLSGGEFPVDAGRPPAPDKKMNTTLADIKSHRIVYIWVLPALLMAGAAVLLIRRKRK